MTPVTRLAHFSRIASLLYARPTDLAPTAMSTVKTRTGTPVATPYAEGMITPDLPCNAIGRRLPKKSAADIEKGDALQYFNISFLKCLKHVIKFRGHHVYFNFKDPVSVFSRYCVP